MCMCVCVHKWNWVIDGKNVNYSAVGRLLDKYLNIHWNQKTTKISRDIISNSDKSIYAVVHWATLPKWNADKRKKDQRMLSKDRAGIGHCKGKIWRVWQKGLVKREKQCKSELLGKAKSYKCHVTCLQHRSKDTPTFPPAWLYKTK